MVEMSVNEETNVLVVYLELIDLAMKEIYQLMRKQTILVCIASMTSVITWLLMISAFKFHPIYAIDVVVNVISVYLMFVWAKPVWECCGNYGLCYFME